MKTSKLIEVKKCEFSYVEHVDYVIKHPVSGYYFKLNDVSVNVVISFKWVLFAHFFLDSISKTMIELNNSEENINNFIEEKINYKADYVEHKMFIDDIEIYSKEDLIKKIEKEYDDRLFNENTKIRMKLKINLNDFLLLQNVYIPTLFFYEDTA